MVIELQLIHFETRSGHCILSLVLSSALALSCSHPKNGNCVI